MTLRLSNTLTRRCEPFVPRVPGQVSIYCCGVTVYDLCHLGHARSYIVWDVLRRYLTWSGFAVTFVQNITDIDDKILRRAREERSSMEEVSERNITAFQKDMAALNILPPDRMPRATRCLDEIRELIGELEAKGAAYSADGDVYFAVTKAAGYGKLSGRDLAEQQDNAAGRVSDQEELRKHHPFDFALWKGTKPGEPSYPSPWGPGRPGWHIECSAMVLTELGESIDIHLGGSDLIFPHHENEIAQSEAATGMPLARFWLHNGMVNVGGEKMSKSLGNFTTIRALLEGSVSPMGLRLFVLQAHYRKPLDFTAEGLEAATAGWRGLNAALGVGDARRAASPLSWAESDLDDGQDVELSTRRDAFAAAMDDDLNTSAALAVLFELARPLRSLANRLARGDECNGEDRRLEPRWRLLVELAGVLGLKAETKAQPQDTSNGTGPSDERIQELIEQRRCAKSARDYATADGLRDHLRRHGIELIDRPTGSTDWIRK